MSLKISKHQKIEEPAPRLSLEERMDRASLVSQQIHARKEERKLNSKKLSLNDVAHIWYDTVHETFPEAPEVSVKREEALILQAEMKRYTSRKEPITFVEFVRWSIENWTRIMGVHFSTMLEPPKYPAIRFFVKCVGKFLFAHSQKQELERVSKMTTREKLIYKLVSRGMDQETAEREVDEKLGLLKIKDEIMAERRKLQQLQNNSREAVLLDQRLRMMERAAERKETRAVKGIGGTFEQWT